MTDHVVSVALADDKGVVIAGKAQLAFDVPSDPRRAAVLLLALLGLCIGFLIIGRGTDWRWLRDDYGIPVEAVPWKARSFSLARCQMAWWTLIITVSWFSIGYATGDWTSLDDTSLMLMGVSASTLVGGAAAIPDGLKAKVDAWRAAVTAAAGVDAALAALRGDPCIKHETLLKDLTADCGDGTALHRVQIIVFALSYGTVYAWRAYHDGTLPVVPPTMLALLGISSGAYVGYKWANK